MSNSSIEAETINVHAKPGATIHSAIEDSIILAEQYRAFVFLKFNGKELRISRIDTVEQKVKEYFEK